MEGIQFSVTFPPVGVGMSVNSVVTKHIKATTSSRVLTLPSCAGSIIDDVLFPRPSSSSLR